jgi:hypothetical protein
VSDPIDDFFDLNFDYYVPDIVLASIPLPENENSRNTNRTSNGEKICTNSVFNNCIINFVVNDKKLIPHSNEAINVLTMYCDIASLCENHYSCVIKK